jgi:hypothetical protein
MQCEKMCKRLLESAKRIGWEAIEQQEFVSPRFRGRDDNADVSLPTAAKGLMIGPYPVLVCDIELGSSESIMSVLHPIHNQMIIARSYMDATEVINAHIILVGKLNSQGIDPDRIIDLIERDETVCRKLIWLLPPADLEISYREFLERTFLAQPWAFTDEQDNAPLDHNDSLLEKSLQNQGLSAAAAEKWVRLAEKNFDDPEDLVEALVAAMEESE